MYCACGRRFATLYINAPDLPRAGSTRIYALSVGEMRSVAELRDEPTAALIARVIDFKKDPDAPWRHFTTRLDNVAAAAPRGGRLGPYPQATTRQRSRCQRVIATRPEPTTTHAPLR
jgi:hypothetical protein